MTDIFVGSVSVGVTPDARGIDDELRRQLIPSANRVGAEMGKEMTKAIISNLDIGRAFMDSVRANLAQIARAGDQAGKEFGKAAKDRAKAELAGLNIHAKLDLDTKSAKADWERFKKETEKGKGILAKIALDTTGLGKSIATEVSKGVSGASGAGRGFFSRLFGGGGGGNIVGDILKAVEGGGGDGGGTGTVTKVSTLSQLGKIGGAISSAAGPTLIGAGIVGSPFIGQQLAGFGVGGLGAGIAGLGILGAIMSGKLSKQWAGFTGTAKKDLISIGQPMVPVLQSILSTASKLMGVLTPVFRLAESIIAGPLQVFTNTLIKAFAQPSVKQSITAVAKAFGDILNAMTPNIISGISSLAGAIAEMANEVAKHPKAFSDFVRFLLDIPVAIVKLVTWLTIAANWIESHWTQIWQRAGWVFNLFAMLIKTNVDFIVGIFRTVKDLLAGNWGAAWNDIKDAAHSIWKEILKEAGMIVSGIVQLWHDAYNQTGAWFKRLGHNIVAHLDEIRHDFAQWGNDVVSWFIHLWGDIYGGTIGAIIRMANHARQLFDDWRHDLAQWGDDVISWLIRLWDSIYSHTIGALIRLTKDGMTKFDDLKTKVINFFKDAPTWLLHAGEDIINGLFAGMKNIVATAGSWIQNNVVNPITNIIKGTPFGFIIKSPSQKTIPIGKALVQGILHGMVTEGKRSGTFVAEFVKGLSKAMVLNVSKGLDLSKLPKTTKNFLNKAFIDPFAQTPTSVASRPPGTLPKGGTTGSPAANGRELYNYLLDHVFGGNKIAAAGATASIWGESGWNPFAIGPGGSRGLIQWTPGSKISNAVFQGGMRTQLPAIIDFISKSGDWGVINQMKRVANVTDAAYLWGKGVERYGVSDVHPQGIKLATAFMDYGGWIPPGATMVYNMTGQHEMVLSPAQQAELLGSGRIDSAVADGPTYNAHFDSLTGQAIESHVRTAFAMMSLTQGHLARPGRRT